MNENKTRKHFIKILIINAFVLTALSMVHPITPKLINENNLPTFYFGLLFGCMSISTFIASPTFGSICEIYGKKLPMMIGVLGYAVGQIFFGFFPNAISVIFARILSGTFVAGYYVGSMSYVSNLTKSENKLKNLAYLNASSSIGVAFGSYLGGRLGVNDYKLTFIVQIIICILSIISIFLFVNDISLKKKETKINIKVFSVKDFKEIKKSNNLIFIVLMLVMITYIGIQSYTSTISYYVEDVLKLPTTINGLILGATGVFTLISNLLFIPILNKFLTPRKLYLSSVLISCISILISMMVNISSLSLIFILVFMLTHTLIPPITQAMLLEYSRSYESRALGLQNGFKSIGSFLGAVLSGVIFSIWFKLPFIISGISLILCFIILIRYKNKPAE